MTSPTEPPPMARPLVAAGALFLNEAHHILLVRPTYKPYWDIPGGYVEPNESPLAACTRELHEELGLTVPIGPLLVVDWAPADGEGDKLLFVYEGGTLTPEDLSNVTLQRDEISELRFVDPAQLEHLTPPRLTRRLTTALTAKQLQRTQYAEHGLTPTRR